MEKYKSWSYGILVIPEIYLLHSQSNRIICGAITSTVKWLAIQLCIHFCQVYIDFVILQKLFLYPTLWAQPQHLNVFTEPTSDGN